MGSDDLVAQFISLFDGNRTAVGTETGGCLRLNHGEWEGRIAYHLEEGGAQAIGVYPMVASQFGNPKHDWIVKWGCVDFDEGEEASWLHARRLQALLAKCGVTAWIERSRSKGYHAWVFGDWTPAHIVRRGLLKACQAVGAPTREINPKSEGSDDPNFLSNYVRLPFPGWLGRAGEVAPSDARRVVIDSEGKPWSLRNFVVCAQGSAGMQGLEKLAALWQPPKLVIQRNVVDISDDELEEALGRVSARTIGVLMDGPTRGQGRSETLFWLAQLLVRDGNHTFDECVALVRYGDARWAQKYVDRPDAERRYTEMIEKAWDQ